MATCYNAVTYRHPGSGYTVLMEMAAHHDWPDTATLLIETAQKDCKDKQPSCMKDFFEARDQCGVSALHMAIISGHMLTAKILRDKGAFVDLYAAVNQHCWYSPANTFWRSSLVDKLTREASKFGIEIGGLPESKAEEQFLKLVEEVPDKAATDAELKTVEEDLNKINDEIEATDAETKPDDDPSSLPASCVA